MPSARGRGRGRPKGVVAPCRFCNKIFKRQEHLARHERTHTREKPFICSCGLSFTRKDLLSRHYRLSCCNATEDLTGEVPISASEQGWSTQPQSHDENDFVSTAVPFQQRHENASTIRGAIYTVVDNGHQGLDTWGADTSQNPQIDMLSEDLPSHGVWVDVTSTEDMRTSIDNAYLISTLLDWSGNDIHLDQDFAESYTSSSGKVPSPWSIECSVSHADNQPVQSKTNGQTSQNVAGVDLLSDLSLSHENINSKPWTISSKRYENLRQECQSLKGVLPDNFTFPGHQTLSRCLQGYCQGFHPHLPFLHLPSTSTDDMPLRLLLALAAVGAFYRFEHQEGYSLIYASRSILNHHFDSILSPSRIYLMKSFPAYADSRASLSSKMVPNHDREGGIIDLPTIQAILVILQVSMWLDSPVHQVGFSMSGWLATLLRPMLCSDSLKASPDTWGEWVATEQLRRTLYSVFVTSNLITLCYDLPPILTTGELNFRLPCSVAEWEAATAQQWHSIRRNGSMIHSSFSECFSTILKGQRLDEQISITSFGNYVLIQALIQQLWYERRTFRRWQAEDTSSTFSPETVEAYKEALAVWRQSWESTKESSLSSASPNGPMGFNSTAMYRIVHLRLSVDLADRSLFHCRDPAVLASVFTKGRNPVSLRTPHIQTAVLQAIHMLRLITIAGVPFVARTRTSHWSVQHALASFECALLLTRWLQCVADHVRMFSYSTLEDNERSSLEMLASVIKDTHMANDLRGEPGSINRVLQLTTCAAELWAESCKTVHVFEIVHVIEKTFALVASVLKDQLKESG